jgi:hypothetical protein
MTMAKEFDELVIDGHNYPTWTSDIKIKPSLLFIVTVPN